VLFNLNKTLKKRIIYGYSKLSYRFYRSVK